VFPNQGAQFSDYVGMPTGIKIQLDPSLQGTQPSLDQTRHLIAMEHLRRHVVQRRAPPQCERLTLQTDLDCGVGCPAGVLKQLIETHQVQLTSRERDQKAVRPGNNQPVAQPPTQPTHIRLCGSPSISRRSIPPNPADQLHRRHHTISTQQQRCKQRPLLARRHSDLRTVTRNLQRTKNPELHASLPSTEAAEGVGLRVLTQGRLGVRSYAAATASSSGKPDRRKKYRDGQP